MATLREDAQAIIDAALLAAQPDTAVRNALLGFSRPRGKLLLIAVGKAASGMAKAACETLREGIDGGAVITKYGHSNGALPPLRLFEAGHPVPDENAFAATQYAIDLVSDLTADDAVLFLLSGGGSALFEKPLIPNAELSAITERLLACGADIVEMNTIRKRFSAVKGGRFAALCAPAQVYSIVLSDILGDPLDMIASGPTCVDGTTAQQAAAIIQKYDIPLSAQAQAQLWQETPKHLPNAQSRITGSVRQLCIAAQKVCAERGYTPMVLTASLRCTARDAGSFLASIAQYHADAERSMAFLAGGETIVQLTGAGLGGRNQEIALAAANEIGALSDVAVFSFGSDGTDGPTDAAGGYCDHTTKQRLQALGISIPEVLQHNDSYHALKRCDGLIMTGPTGTNVNDLSVVLIKR